MKKLHYHRQVELSYLIEVGGELGALESTSTRNRRKIFIRRQGVGSANLGIPTSRATPPPLPFS